MNTDNAHIGRQPVDEERLDSVIDAVAREMTEFEPSGALRARVMERIGDGRRRATPAVPRWAWAGGATAAAVLAVAAAVWVVSPMQTRDDGPAAIAEQRSVVPPLTAAGARRPVTQPAASPGAGPPSTALPAATRTSRIAAARGARTTEEVLQDGHPVPALAEIEPLRFSAVAPDPLQIAAVEVAPLEAVPTIDIPSLDSGSTDIQSADSKKEK